MFDHARFEAACHSGVEVAGTIGKNVDTVGAVHNESPGALKRKAKNSKADPCLRQAGLAAICKNRNWARDDSKNISRAPRTAAKTQKQIPACGRQASPPFAKTATGLGMTARIPREPRGQRQKAKTDSSPPFPQKARDWVRNDKNADRMGALGGAWRRQAAAAPKAPGQSPGSTKTGGKQRARRAVPLRGRDLREELAGGEIFQGAKAGIEFGGCQAALALEVAEKVRSWPVMMRGHSSGCRRS